ncbi:MAG: hypothetical protein QE278_01680 [Limnobacter sp.]|nr:hypothetical protein [Limnobacter sp.]
MNYYDTNDPSGVHWSDSMDEGLLTLEAEWFLMTLPKQLIPRMTCLMAPELLNQLVAQWTVEHAKTNLNTESDGPLLFNPTGAESTEIKFKLPASLNLKHLEKHETAISAELLNLCKWLNLTQNLLYEETSKLKAA